MDRDDETILGAAIDRAMDEVLADDLPAFGGERALRSLGFRFLQQHRRRWRRAHTCVFPGCGNRSIRASHTIQEAALRLIADDGVLLTPSFDLCADQPVMLEVGVGEASTFPGYCEQHEALFADFERHGSIGTRRHAELQLFRTVCREVVARRHEVELFDRLIEAKERLLREHFLSRILAGLDAAYLARHPDIQVEAAENLSERLQALRELRHERAADLPEFEREFFARAAQIVDGPLTALSWFHFSTGTLLPVAMAGRSVFRVQRLGTEEVVHLIMCVVPAAAGSDILVGCRWEHEDFLTHLFEAWPPSPARMQSLIEGWMVFGTDHWFIRPSYWRGLPVDLQDRVLREHHEVGGHVGFRLDYSIL